MRLLTETVKLKQKKKIYNLINWRFIFLYSSITLPFVFILFRLGWLQIVIPDLLIHQGDMRSLYIQKTSTARGMITDRYGKLLAVSVPVKAIWIDSKELHNSGGIVKNDRWIALSETLKISLDQIEKLIRAKPKRQFIYLARQVDFDIAEYIKKLKLPGVHFREEYRRYYPSGEVTAQLIGFTNIDSQGIEGIEKSFDTWLTGCSGERILRRDRYGRIIEDVASIDSKKAKNLALSIDERLQSLVYREINKAVAINQAESGSAVLLDIDTGEILAIANSPSYNPHRLAIAARHSIRNRAITDTFEPGSTVKPMVIMTALQKGIIEKNSVLDTTPYRINNHEIKDVMHYNELSITEILQKSSNVGVSKLALAMPSSALVDTYSRFGLGKSTNLGLVGEHNGFFPKKKQWSRIEKATFSFGYGLMVTPLQLARVYATIGSYGIYRPLSITKVSLPVSGERIFSESIVRTVIHMMESVALPGGGGEKAAIKGYRIAIKTGTAKKVGPDGFYIKKYTAYTAGIAPASHPRLALVVVINDPKAGKYYGGTVSAPVFGAIMKNALRTMNIQPDAIKINKKTNITLSKSKNK